MGRGSGDGEAGKEGLIRRGETRADGVMGMHREGNERDGERGRIK